MPLRDIALNMCPDSATLVTRPIQEVGIVNFWVLEGGYADLSPALRATLHNAVSLAEVLQSFGQALPAIECLRNLKSIIGGKLEVDVRADGGHCSPSLAAHLFQELMAPGQTHPELTAFAKKCLDSAVETLMNPNFIRVDGEERPVPSKKSVAP